MIARWWNQASSRGRWPFWVSGMLAMLLGCGNEKLAPVVTHYDDLTAVTAERPEGLHTELFGSGGHELLATMDVRETEAVWQDWTGMARVIQESQELDPATIRELSEDPESLTWVSALPRSADESNELVVRLHEGYELGRDRGEPAGNGGLPGEEVPYQACGFMWDNCVICYFGYCWMLCCRDDDSDECIVGCGCVPGRCTSS